MEAALKHRAINLIFNHYICIMRMKALIATPLIQQIRKLKTEISGLEAVGCLFKAPSAPLNASAVGWT